MATTKPKHPDKLGDRKLTPAEQLKRFHAVVGSPAHGDIPTAPPVDTDADKPSKNSAGD